MNHSYLQNHFLLAVTVSVLALSACATPKKPPEISYDDTPHQATIQQEPIRPVQIVEVPRPLPLPGQLKPLNEFARAANPFSSVGKAQISVEVSSVIRASDTSFRVAWTERRFENGKLSTTERWTAILTVVLEQPRDADHLRKNPLGVFVNAISWSKELSQ